MKKAKKIWHLYGKHSSIKSYEPRQIRKKAAINSVLCESMFSIEMPYCELEVSLNGRIYSIIQKI